MSRQIALFCIHCDLAFCEDHRAEHCLFAPDHEEPKDGGRIDYAMAVRQITPSELMFLSLPCCICRGILLSRSEAAPASAHETLSGWEQEAEGASVVAVKPGERCAICNHARRDHYHMLGPCAMYDEEIEGLCECAMFRGQDEMASA